jgi:hypothetical protein
MKQSRGNAGTHHVFKVQSVMLCGLGAAAVGAQLHLSGTLPGSIYMTLAQLVLALVVGATHLTQQGKGIVWWRFALFLAFGLCAGANVGTWIENALQESGLCKGEGWTLFPGALLLSSSSTR